MRIIFLLIILFGVPPSVFAEYSSPDEACKAINDSSYTWSPNSEKDPVLYTKNTSLSAYSETCYWYSDNSILIQREYVSRSDGKFDSIKWKIYGSCIIVPDEPDEPDEPDSCHDSIKNNDETGIDCGGSCLADCTINCPPGTDTYLIQPIDAPSWFPVDEDTAVCAENVSTNNLGLCPPGYEMGVVSNIDGTGDSEIVCSKVVEAQVSAVSNGDGTNTPLVDFGGSETPVYTNRPTSEWDIPVGTGGESSVVSDFSSSPIDTSVSGSTVTSGASGGTSTGTQTSTTTNPDGSITTSESSFEIEMPEIADDVAQGVEVALNKSAQGADLPDLTQFGVGDDDSWIPERKPMADFFSKIIDVMPQASIVTGSGLETSGSVCSASTSVFGKDIVFSLCDYDYIFEIMGVLLLSVAQIVAIFTVFGKG